MKRGDINRPENIGPKVLSHRLVGPNIEVPGWNQTYSSPYVIPDYPVDTYTGPWGADLTRGRHQYRTQPRTLGPSNAVPPRLLPSIEKSLSPSFVPGSLNRPGHGMGAFGLDSGSRVYLGMAAGAVAGFLLVRQFVKPKKFNVYQLLGGAFGGWIGGMLTKPAVD